jgi:hypothetical protein
MSFSWTLIVLSLAAGTDNAPSQADALRKAGETPLKAHRNHVRRASAEYLSFSRRITWYYDFATAAELARETGRPLFVIFCRAGTIDDPLTGKPKCSS